jgi:hypothetical protein
VRPRLLLAALAVAGASLIAWLLLRTQAPAPGGLGSVDVSAPPRARPDLSPPPPRRDDGGVQVVVRGAWGGGDGQFGRGDDPDAPGPPALAADASGGIGILDAANRRVQRFDRAGTPLPPIPIGSDSARDLALGVGGRVLVLDRKGGVLTQHTSDGRVLGSILLQGSGVRDPEQVTAVIAERDGSALIEIDRRRVLRIADPAGKSLAARPSVPGRPRRDGAAYLTVLIGDRRSGSVTVRALDDQGRPRWESPVSFGAPLLRVVWIDSDLSGRTYVAAETGRESPTPPDRLIDLHTTVIALDAAGVTAGTLTLDAGGALAVAGDGTIYRLRAGRDGVIVESYRL